MITRDLCGIGKAKSDRLIANLEKMDIRCPTTSKVFELH